MVEDAAGGGGGGTNWWSTSVPQMWAMLAQHDTNPQWTHVTGWQKAYELTSYHLSRMTSYREKIAVAWPPERNEAAHAYLTKIDDMIASIQATHDAASTNHTTVSAVTGAIDNARYRLKPIHDEYVANEQKLSVFAAPGLPAPGSRPTPAPSPLPAPVAPGRQEQLATQARNIMIELSGTLASARYTVVSPPAYRAPLVNKSERQDLGPGGGSPPLVAPFIPPLGTTPPPAAPRTPTAPQLPPPDGSHLSGRPIAPPAQVVPPTLPVPARPPGTGTVPGVIGPVPGAVPSGAGRVPPLGGVIQPPLAGVGSATRPGGVMPGAALRPMQPGGVIGAPAGTGLGQPGAGRPTQRINPVGGVIGGQPGGAATGSPRSGNNPAGANPTGANPTGAGRSTLGSFRTADGHLVSVSGSQPANRRDEPESSQHWDPDNPWATDEGVTPVVEPPATPGRHESGPAIGLGR